MVNVIVRGSRADDIENIDLLGQPMKSITSGFGHVLILSENEKLFSFGRNDCGQLGFESENPDEVDVLKITPIPWSNSIKSIHCGSLHSMILSDDNCLFSCGSNAFGQCSQPTLSGPIIAQFTLIEIDEIVRNKIATIICKFAHSGFVTSDRELYCCGRNHDLEIGIQNSDNVNKFTKVPNIPPVKLVDFAWKYTVIVTMENEIYSSKHGILRTECTLNPCIGKYCGWNPSINGEIVKLQCGNEHTILLTQNMELFGFGYSPNGEIGVSQSSIIKEVVRIGGSILDRVCNFVTSYNQLIVFTTGGTIYVSGLNTRGQLNFSLNNNMIDSKDPVETLTPVSQSRYFNSACIGNQFTILYHRTEGQFKIEKLFKQQLFSLALHEYFFDTSIVFCKE